MSKIIYDPRIQIISCLRRTFGKSPAALKVFEEALSSKKGPRGGKCYKCAKCGKDFPRNKIILDHIIPVVPVTIAAKDMDLMDIHNNIFCDVLNLQVLCKKCSTIKTNKENTERRKNKKILTKEKIL